MHIKHDPTPGTDISDTVNFGSSGCWSGRFPENLRRAALEVVGVFGVVILGHVHYCGGVGPKNIKATYVQVSSSGMHISPGARLGGGSELYSSHLSAKIGGFFSTPQPVQVNCPQSGKEMKC
jgi:hypothetical protein